MGMRAQKWDLTWWTTGGRGQVGTGGTTRMVGEGIRGPSGRTSSVYQRRSQLQRYIGLRTVVKSGGQGDALWVVRCASPACSDCSSRGCGQGRAGQTRRCIDNRTRLLAPGLLLLVDLLLVLLRRCLVLLLLPTRPGMARWPESAGSAGEETWTTGERACCSCCREVSPTGDDATGRDGCVGDASRHGSIGCGCEHEFWSGG